MRFFSLLVMQVHHLAGLDSSNTLSRTCPSTFVPSGTPLGVKMSIERRRRVGGPAPISAQFPAGKLGGNWALVFQGAAVSIDMPTPKGVSETSTSLKRSA